MALYEIVIRGGRVVNGTGNPWFRADVAVKEGKISEIGLLGDVEAKRVIGAEGLVVSPGFVDMHNHSDSGILLNPKADNYIHQGVTLIVFPNCGGGLFPVREDLGGKGRRLEIDWSTYEEYLQKMERTGTSVNVAPLVGFGTIRRYVMGYEMREPTPGELDQMKAFVEEAMKAGAFGLTTGLRYVPQSYAKTEEVIELSKVAAKYGGFYTTHMRDEGDRGDPVGSVREVIEIAERAGLPANISHFKILAKPFWDKCDEILQIIEEARNRGLDITADQYPYPASGTGPGAWIPKWASEGGQRRLAERLRDPELGSKIKEGLIEVMNLRGGPERQLIGSYPSNPSYVGKTVAEVARELGGDPADVFFNLFKESVERGVAGEPSGFGLMSFNMSDENVEKMMKRPWVMVSTDGGIRVPSPGKIVSGHPRNYGTYPRVLGRYVREKKVLGLEEAVRKMTSLETQRLGIFNRGLIAEGMWADITIFDPEKVIDKAEYTPQEESLRYPEGIPYVIVNGILTIDEDKHTGAFAGKILRKR